MEKGVNKKIDELGRVVIPKDIRNNLKLKTGDILNINLDNDVIKLTKHSDPEVYKSALKKIVDLFKDIFDIDMIITDREKIVVSSNGLYIGNVDTGIKNMVLNGEYFNNNEMKSYRIGDETVTAFYCIEPLITSLSSVGAIIILSPTELGSVYVKVTKFLAKYIQSVFDISC